MSQLITEKELCEYLKISLRHAVTLRQRRLIPHLRLGYSVRYNLPDVEKALQKLTVRSV